MKIVAMVIIAIILTTAVFANQAPKIKDITVKINDIEIQGWAADGHITQLLWMQYNIYCPMIYCLNDCRLEIK